MILAKNIFCLNEQGRRQNNQDFVSPAKGTALPAEQLFIVCDGVGGEKRGEVASALAATSIRQYFEETRAETNGHRRIADAIGYANKQLAGYAAEDVSAKRMSTTLSLAVLGRESVLVAWCGDSRIYHIREGRVLWMSGDHSLVYELVRSGELSETEAAVHPQRNIITRSLNAANRNNEVEFHELTHIAEGDYLLLCTDGFLEQIGRKQLASVLTDESKPDKAAAFYAICEGATKDNFSMYLVELTRYRQERRSTPVYKILLILLLFVVIGLLFYFLM